MLSYILSSDPAITVIGVAADGAEAIAMTARLKPDLVTMDIVMPVMDGYEATRKIMEQTPVPIIVVSSSYDPTEISCSFRAIEAGALLVLAKPVGIGHPFFERQSRELVNAVKALSDVKVVRRRPKAAVIREDSGIKSKETAGNEVRMIVIGASTGGPPVIQSILVALPKNMRVPIAIVQHMTTGFTTGFATWLADSTGLRVRVPENGELCLAGSVYIAPDNVHMVFDHCGRILLNSDPPDDHMKPSVQHLFNSAAKVFREKCVGVLLTGMGRDGADGLKAMRDVGAVTIAQDKDSSVVFGMNGEAVKLEAACHILPAERIAGALMGLVKGSSHE
jgi:two-component system chemotaxis response regulator CheB